MAYKFIEGGVLNAALNDPPSAAKRPGGWAVSEQNEPYIIDLASDPVPASATFLGGSAYSTDGARYVTSDAPSGAQMIGGQAIRNDGALHITTSDPEGYLGRWGHTADGKACVEPYVRAVVEGGLVAEDVTFTRNSTATYFDSDGLLQTASANEARTTYIDGVPYLLMEGARTNLLTRSEEFDHADWTKTRSNVTPNASTAPDGAATADKIVEDTSNNSHYIFQSQSKAAEALTYTGSFFAKAGERDRVNVWLTTEGFSQSVRVTFDLTEKTAAVDSEITFTGGSARIVEGENSWFGCIITATTSTATTINMLIGLDDGTGRSYQGDGSSGLYIWGAQLEQASHESSYIKTTTAAVSRAADSASLANSIISGLTEGTIYAEVYTDHLTSGAARHIAELESDASNFIRVQHSADGDLDAQITDGGVSQATLAGTDLTVGTLQKVALTFKEDEFSLYRGGARLATDTSGTVPSIDTLLIGAGLYGGVKTMNVHTTAWSQAKAEAETT